MTSSYLNDCNMIIIDFNYSLNGSSKTLKAPFDAFKFPNSDVVQFKALVTPCLGACAPVQCNVQDYLGYQRKVDSLGRRKRRAAENATLGGDSNLLVVQSIRISDKFQVPSDGPTEIIETELSESEVVVLSSDPSHTSAVPPCLNLLVIHHLTCLFFSFSFFFMNEWINFFNFQ